MIDYTHIPLHIRCTERYKIDPEYPDDDAKWWKYQTERGDKDQARWWSNDELNRVADRYVEAERKRNIALGVVREHGEATLKQIADALGVPTDNAQRVIIGMGEQYPLYEYEKNGRTRFGILQDTGLSNLPVSDKVGAA